MSFNGPLSGERASIPEWLYVRQNVGEAQALIFVISCKSFSSSIDHEEDDGDLIEEIKTWQGSLRSSLPIYSALEVHPAILPAPGKILG